MRRGKRKTKKEKVANKKSRRRKSDDTENKDEEEDEPKKKGKKHKKGRADEVLEKHDATHVTKGDPERGVPKGNIDMTKLDRRTLKGMAKDLGVDYSKEMSDDEVRGAVSKAMIGIDKVVEAKINEADAAKINDLKDCLGLFIDLSNATCIACPLQQQCRAAFDQHRMEGFSIFDKLKKKEAPKEDKKSKKGGAVDLVAVAGNAKRGIECYDPGKLSKLAKVTLSDGSEVDDHTEYKAVIKDVMATVPETVGKLSKVILRHYDPEKDNDASRAKLVAFFLDYFIKIELIALV